MNRNNESQPTPLTEHALKNRSMWEAQSDGYDSQHADVLSGSLAMAWGLWRIPEAELQILGEVTGRDILELGCGAARWSIALAQQGAHPVGLDLSSQQLAHARRLMDEAGISFPLVEASAEAVPLPNGSFDIVFCDWGAMTFCDPYLTVPEAARLLRPGGLLAFATSTPFYFVCYDQPADVVREQLLRDYFGLHRTEWDDEVNFDLPYGEWLRLFRLHGLIVEDLIETQPPTGATTSYRGPQDIDWARKWPMENIWRVRKPAQL
ncbi:MAG: class I SAM-dependent methyltransferase [Ktedonobacterales bacterium]